MKAARGLCFMSALFLLIFLTGAQNAWSTIYSVRVDRTAHQKFGLSYPVTYKFQIPAGGSGLGAQFRYSDDAPWTNLPEVKQGDTFNGIEAVRFDYGGGFAYISVRLQPDSDVLYVRVVDSSGRETDMSFDSITRLYDDRKGAVTITLDDYGDWSNSDFTTAAGILSGMGVRFSVGVITGQVNDWSLLQDMVNRYGDYLEISSHSAGHYCDSGSYASNGYDRETAGSRDALRQRLTFGGTAFIPLFIEPCGYSDTRLETAITSANYLVSRSVGSSYQAGSTFAPWDSQQVRYGRASVVFNDYGRSNNSALLAEANGLFDRTVADGGIYHLLNHPAMGLWKPRSPFIQHLEHIKGRSDLWYVGLGQLYQYHYLQEMRGNLTIKPYIVGTPVADFTANPVEGRAPLTVAFNDTSTGRITGWQWDFGDGATSTERSPVHTYEWSGIFTATLVVTNEKVKSMPVSTTIAADSPYRIGTSSVGSGTITCSPGNEIAYRTRVSCTATPGYGNRIAEVVVDGIQQAINDQSSFTISFGPVTADHGITASFVPLTHEVAFISAGGGTITGTLIQSVEHGGSTTAVTANPATGYLFAGWSAPGGFASTANPLVLTGITSGQTVTATFSRQTFRVEFVAAGNGSVTGTNIQTVEYGGSSIAVTAAPVAGYRFAGWSGSGGFTSAENPLIIANVTSAMTVTATFAPLRHIVTPRAGSSGSITPAAPQEVPSGGTVTFTVAPVAGYRIAAVSGCGGSLAGGTYTTAPVTADCTVTAEFMPAGFSVTASVGGGRGNVNCTSPVASGESSTCTILPGAGYQLGTLTDNGVDVTVQVKGGSYVIGCVAGDHEVSATFAPVTYTLSDAVRAQQQVLGKVTLPETERTRLDVAPLGPDGQPRPDGILDVADVVIMLRRLVGAVSW